MTEPDKDSSSSLREVLGNLAGAPESSVSYLRGKVSDFDSKKALNSIRRSPVSIKRALVEEILKVLFHLKQQTLNQALPPHHQAPLQT